MSASACIKIVETGSNESWESKILRGALRAHNIHWSTMALDVMGVLSRDEIAVFLPSNIREFDLLDVVKQIRGPTVIGGRWLSSNLNVFGFTPGESQILILGEPYEFIIRLALSPDLLPALMRRTHTGFLADPNGIFISDESFHANETVPVLTSLGCEKRCAYCPYGAVHREFHGAPFGRRERNGKEIYRECESARRSGASGILLVADQVVSDEAGNNHQLKQLAKSAARSRAPKIPIIFNISPKAVVNNQDLLWELTEGFLLRPTLSLDSLDDETLALFGVGFKAVDGMFAVRELAELGVLLRINYIFSHPWKTDVGLVHELRYLREVGELLAYLTPEWQRLIGGDILLSEFHFLAGAPLSRPGPHQALTDKTRSSAVLAVVKASMSVLVKAARQPDDQSGFLRNLFCVASQAAVDAMATDRNA